MPESPRAAACACRRPSPDAVLCTSCTRDLAMALLTAASIAPDLDDAIARLLKRGGGGKTPPKTEAPLPLDLAASDVRAELQLALRGWVHSTGQRVPWLYGPAHNLACAHPSCIRIRLGSGPSDTIPALARWLTEHLAVLRQQEAAPAMLRDISRHVGRALAVVDRLPERVGAGQCAVCGAQLLAELGADAVQCGCGVFTNGLITRRTARAAAADVLGTATELSGVLGRIGVHVTPGVISKWASRGRLDKRPGAVYRLSDVLALCAERDTRR